eukprot:EG_transcript_26043
MLQSHRPTYAGEAADTAAPCGWLASSPRFALCIVAVVGVFLLWSAQPTPSRADERYAAVRPFSPLRMPAAPLNAETPSGTGFDMKVKKLKEEARAKLQAKEEAGKAKAEAQAEPAKPAAKITPRPLESVVAKPAAAPEPPKSFFPDVPKATKDAFERRFLSTLAILFVSILVFGLVIASSGFFPDEVDEFVSRVIYPLFSPITALFLVLSTLYGLIKSREDPNIRF